MDQSGAVPEMLVNVPADDSVLVSNVKPLFVLGKWDVREMVLTHEKVRLLWEMLQGYRTVFSDLTRGDVSAWVNYVTSSDSLWLEVYEDGKFTGFVTFDGMMKIVDVEAHMMFFDRKPAAKLPVCKAIISYMFENYPIQRITVNPTDIYFATIRLLERMGMTREGTKREAVLLDGKWHAQHIYGITRSDVCRS